MQTSEIALIVSLFSVVIASLSLGWNIYRDVILKAKISIDLSICTLVQEENPHKPRYVKLTATNFGPGSLNLNIVLMKKTSWWRKLFGKEENAILIHDYKNPVSGQLPCKLNEGDRIDLLFPYDKGCMLSTGWYHIGINDFFGRTHWAPITQVKKAVESWNKEFGSVVKK